MTCWAAVHQAFQWQGGGEWAGKPWSEELPTDSALVLFLFAAFLAVCNDFLSQPQDNKPSWLAHTWALPWSWREGCLSGKHAEAPGVGLDGEHSPVRALYVIPCLLGCQMRLNPRFLRTDA